MFALIDCNNFYASCERVFQPKLRNTPIVVLSNNDGCVIARCNLAKAAGVPMGAPAFQFKALFEKNNIAVFSSNYALYGDMSARVMSLLETFTPDMEVYSIDEAFLKFQGFAPDFDYEAYARQIRYTVTKGTGIPVSVGLASTKALAKVANRIAKKYPEQTQNAYVIDSEVKRIKALKWLPIEDVWGIGRRHAQRLNAQGIHRAFDFVNMPEAWVRKHMSVVGLRLQQELKGVSCLDLEQIQPKKNIAVTRSFEKNIESFDYIKERVITFAVTCAEKLRRQSSCCNTITVFVHTNRLRLDQPQYFKSIVMPLPFATNSDIELARFATEALEKVFRNGYAYKKAGVIVSEFSPADVMQSSLFFQRNEKHPPLMKALDSINKLYGVKKVKLASQDPARTWKMRQERLSPCYTTRLADVIHIHTAGCIFAHDLQNAGTMSARPGKAGRTDSHQRTG